MTTYVIEINEDQRLRLTEALNLLRFEHDGIDKEEIDTLFDLLYELPIEEDKHPRIIHSFCR
jgi:lysine/ornithine N-monooxygenase